MGLFDAIGNVVGGVFGGIGGGAADAAGATSNFHAQNPYDPGQIQMEANNQGQIYGQQQSLAQALQQQMAGVGPNPAQSQFQGNVQNNIANAQGMIASQRGLNPALAARMGVNAGTAANQQAANQAATLQAQQQLAAQGQLGGLYGQMQQGNIDQQKLYNQANLGAQGLAQQTAAGNAAIKGQLTGGLLNSAGGIGAAAIGGGAAHGAFIGGNASVPGDSPKNDTVPAMLSPGEIVIPRSKAHDPEKAKEFVDHLLKSKGKDDDKGYGNILEHKRKVAELEKRVKSLEGKKRA